GSCGVWGRGGRLPPRVGRGSGLPPHPRSRLLGTRHSGPRRRRPFRPFPGTSRRRGVHRPTRAVPRGGLLSLMPLASWDRALECTRAALERKAYDLVVLETTKLTSIADYFVICSGRSDTQVQAIAEGVRDHLASLGVHVL